MLLNQIKSADENLSPDPDGIIRIMLIMYCYVVFFSNIFKNDMDTTLLSVEMIFGLKPIVPLELQIQYKDTKSRFWLL